MKDFYATIKIQHGPVREVMGQLGITSAAELARRCNKSPTAIGTLLNFKISPRTESGELTSLAAAVCKTLNAEPEYLFPKHLDFEIETNTISAFVDRAQFAGLVPRQLSPAEECEQADTEQVVDNVLSTLKPNEGRVIKELYFNRRTETDVAEDMNVSRSRVNTLKRTGLSKLRYSAAKRDILRECFDVTEGSEI